MIVELTRESLDAILEIEGLCFNEPWSREIYASEFMHDYSHTWGWMSEGKLIGYLTAWLVFEEFHIANLAVHPSHWRKGIARRLLEFTLRWAFENEATVTLLEVRVSNGAAIRLYSENGFDSVMTRRDYYTNPVEDALILRKDLVGAGEPES